MEYIQIHTMVTCFTAISTTPEFQESAIYLLVIRVEGCLFWKMGCGGWQD